MNHKISLIAIGLLLLSSVAIAQKLPVTDKAFNNDSTTFRFAIVSDRTGGMRAGIFEEAAKKLQLMQPEFVLSVGDLIDGYTNDPVVWNDQWDEFDAIVNQLSMPFYYVPGNHDTSNELLTKVWQQRHGRDFYHFVYKDVLFIALNTDEIEGGGIGKKQAKYIEEALSQNTDVKWTLIFMHRPLWSYGDRQGYDAIEKALKKRSYTLFSGHHHNYRYKIHNGMEHFTLATTGGGSWMRNPEIGELDHITWVTMKPGGPTVAHIDVNGIYDKNLVPEKYYEDINSLRQGTWLKIEPKVFPSQLIEELSLELILTNPTSRVLDVSGNLDQLEGLIAKKPMLSASLKKGETKQISLRYLPENGSINLAQFTNMAQRLSLSAGFNRDEDGRKDIELEATTTVLLDWQHQLQSIKNDQNIEVDGNLDDDAWKAITSIVVDQPQFIHEDWDWKGKDDGNFAFKLAKDQDVLYVGIQFNDEKNISNTTSISSKQDHFMLHFSGLDRTENPTETELLIAYSGDVNSPLIESKNLDSSMIKMALRMDGESSQVLEIAIPIAAFSFSLDQGLRFNVGIMDHDRPENTKPSVLWWRPIWGLGQDYMNSGSFILND